MNGVLARIWGMLSRTPPAKPPARAEPPSRRGKKWQLPEGEQGIEALGHRSYVGGKWDLMGRLQFDYLVAQGLLPRHCLLDIACGSLRAGRYFIPYLAPGHYLGLDKEEGLIAAGKEQELEPGLLETKRPQFVVSSAFEFALFDKRPDFALAQSLFTHLPPRLITACLANLRAVIADDGVFYATIFETDEERQQPGEPHDHGIFYYTAAEMAALGRDTGWSMHYIGDWSHPKNQRMLCYRPA